MATQSAPSTVKSEKITGKFKTFNVEKWEFETTDVDADFTPAATLEEALSRLGNDEKIIVPLLNDVLKERTLESKRPSGPSKNSVLDFIKSWRQAEPFRSMVTTSKGDKDWKPQYDAQTSAILEKTKNIPPVVEMIKSLPSGGDEEGSEE